MTYRAELSSRALKQMHGLPSPGIRQPHRGPARPLFEAATANFSLHSQAKVDTGNQTRGPLLLISGVEDHTGPDISTRSTLKQYRHSTAITELRQFEHRGHSLTIDHGWKEVADAILAWLTARGTLERPGRGGARLAHPALDRSELSAARSSARRPLKQSRPRVNRLTT